jgi:TolA-binding protein
MAVALVFAVSAGCKQKKPMAPKAGELTEVQKAELINKARANYKTLVDRYPDSPFAAQAQERLKALGPAPGAKK